ncbi:MAG: hypothetical protein OES32_16525 [Acidobacteriota bacterium]|nr:hypothetical protein [Acidobacteriota bacterium]MDH3525184.1 hypothetical protein [Acidobacteriota bacterium]
MPRKSAFTTSASASPSAAASAFVVALALLAFAVAPAAHAADHYFGGGFRYLKTVDDLETEGGRVDADGRSFILSYQLDPAGLLKLEADLEVFDGGFGDATGTVYSPQVFALVGGTLYGGVGAGLYYLSSNQIGSSSSDVFYLGRLGLQLTLLPRIHLDLNANYQTDAFAKVFDGAGSDAITLGAMVRFRIR